MLLQINNPVEGLGLYFSKLYGSVIFLTGTNIETGNVWSGKLTAAVTGISVAAPKPGSVST